MASTAFDTLAAAKRLREAGADQRLAEALAATVNDALHGNLDTLAKKADLESGLAALEARLYRHLWTMFGGTVAIIGTFIAMATAIVKFLP